MNPTVEYRKTYDSSGAMTGLELVQGTNVVKITFEAKGTHYHGGRWLEVREVIDKFQEQASQEVLVAIKNRLKEVNNE